MLARSLNNSIIALYLGGPVIALVFFVALFAAFATNVAALETSGAVFMGQGFVDDRPVADGAVVEAWVRGEPVARARVFDSEFEIFV
jgi:hypothetical protein